MSAVVHAVDCDLGEDCTCAVEEGGGAERSSIGGNRTIETDPVAAANEHDGSRVAPATGVISFTVAGEPAGQGSKTVAHTKTGRTFVREDNPATEPWRNAVSAAAERAMAGRGPFSGAVMLEATFRFPRPKAHFGTGKNADRLKDSAPTYCTSRRDLDKLLRAVGDAISGIVCRDDSQIAEVYAVKVYGSPGLEAHVTELVVSA